MPHRLLSSCLHIDFRITAQSVTRSPKREDLIKSVLPELEQFRDFIKSVDEGCELFLLALPQLEQCKLKQL